VKRLTVHCDEGHSQWKVNDIGFLYNVTGRQMNSWSQRRAFVTRLAGFGVVALLVAALVSSSLCAGPICAMPTSDAPSGCAGVDIPKGLVSMAAVSVPACCQISQAPPARTTQNTALKCAERNVLPVGEGPAITVSFASGPFVPHRVVLSLSVNRQSLLSVFLI